jgi:3'(2'), 5'-bisphosphate nucleotidase
MIITPEARFAIETALAAGEVYSYPRFIPTMEWDTAAGHAILNAAGKKLIDVVSGKELVYNKEDLHNPGFIAQ